MTGKLLGIVGAAFLALWTLPADAKSGGISYAKNRYAPIHEQQTADGQKPGDGKVESGAVLSKAETKKP